MIVVTAAHTVANAVSHELGKPAIASATAKPMTSPATTNAVVGRDVARSPWCTTRLSGLVVRTGRTWTRSRIGMERGATHIPPDACRGPQLQRQGTV